MPAPDPLTPLERRARFVGVGCLMTFLGFVSMAMVGALLSAVMAYLTRAATCPDIPACNWYIYSGIGGLAGAVTLPTLVLRRLMRSPPSTAVETPKR